MSSWVTPAFDAAVFTASASFPPGFPAPTWVVASGDRTTFTYRLVGKRMLIAFYLVTTTVADGPVSLQITIPLGRVAKRTVSVGCDVEDNGTAVSAHIVADGTLLLIQLANGALWANSTNLTLVSGEIDIEVMTATDTTGL